MKFRILTDEELKHLEEDFKQFLIVNHIYNDDWNELNQSNPEKALEIVELFSDNVLQKVYEKIHFLEFHSPNSCMFFNVQDNVVLLISLQLKKEFEGFISLDSTENIHVALKNHLEKLKYFKTSKKISDSRELEIHRLFEGKCIISTEDMWNSLIKSL